MTSTKAGKHIKHKTTHHKSKARKKGAPLIGFMLLFMCLIAAGVLTGFIHRHSTPNIKLLEEAVEAGDAEICFDMTLYDDTWFRDRCITEVVNKTLDHKPCKKVVRRDWRDRCYKFAALGTGDDRICNLIEGVGGTAKCIRLVAVETDNPGLCHDIREETEEDFKHKRKCLKHFGEEF
jgi:hypothetical protein